MYNTTKFIFDDAPKPFQITINFREKNVPYSIDKIGRHAIHVEVGKKLPNSDMLELGGKISEYINDDFKIVINTQMNLSLLIEGMILGLTDVRIYKKSFVENQIICVQADEKFINAYEIALINAHSYNIARMLNIMPHSNINPSTMPDTIKELFKNTKAKLTFYYKDECIANDFVGLLAVSSGSFYEPVMVKIEYQNGNNKKIGLVGKGLTFDTGGYSIKKGRDESPMKADMAGCNAVIGAMYRLISTNSKVNVTAYLPITDNLINSTAMLPGDVIKYPNGLSVEIINTDFEGRLVLADGLILAQKEKCDEIIDIATLTGAVVSSLGDAYAGLMCNDTPMMMDLLEINKNTNEKVWPLPLADEYRHFIEGEITDLINLPSHTNAGAITAGLFLESFIKNKKWAHIDMAAMSGKKEFGSPMSGYGVRFLSEYITSQI